MDIAGTGRIIYDLRTEKGMTQRELAEKLGVSDKAVSKWERGQGFPDVSLLPRLTEILGVDGRKLITGDLDEQEKEVGNMKKMNFYVCPVCGNIFTATGQGDISCCGRKLEPLEAKEIDEEHKPNIEKIEGDVFITFDHEMSKEHWISFAAYVGYDRMLLVHLYPEQEATVRFQDRGKGRLFIYCNKHGLMKI